MGIKTLYRFIDHTADLGIVVRGEDPKELFRNAALALVDIVVEPTQLDIYEGRDPALEKAIEVISDWDRYEHLLKK